MVVKKVYKTACITKAMIPATGMVNREASKIFPAMVQLIAENRFDNPTPKMLEVIT